MKFTKKLHTKIWMIFETKIRWFAIAKPKTFKPFFELPHSSLQIKKKIL